MKEELRQNLRLLASSSGEEGGAASKRILASIDNPNVFEILLQLLVGDEDTTVRLAASIILDKFIDHHWQQLDLEDRYQVRVYFFSLLEDIKEETLQKNIIWILTKIGLLDCTSSWNGYFDFVMESENLDFLTPFTSAVHWMRGVPNGNKLILKQKIILNIDLFIEAIIKRHLTPALLTLAEYLPPVDLFTDTFFNSAVTYLFDDPEQLTNFLDCIFIERRDFKVIPSSILEVIVKLVQSLPPLLTRLVRICTTHIDSFSSKPELINQFIENFLDLQSFCNQEDGMDQKVAAQSFWDLWRELLNKFPSGFNEISVDICNAFIEMIPISFDKGELILRECLKTLQQFYDLFKLTPLDSCNCSLAVKILFLGAVIDSSSMLEGLFASAKSYEDLISSLYASCFILKKNKWDSLALSTFERIFQPFLNSVNKVLNTHASYAFYYLSFNKPSALIRSKSSVDLVVSKLRLINPKHMNENLVKDLFLSLAALESVDLELSAYIKEILRLKINDFTLSTVLRLSTEMIDVGMSPDGFYEVPLSILQTSRDEATIRLAYGLLQTALTKAYNYEEVVNLVHYLFEFAADHPEISDISLRLLKDIIVVHNTAKVFIDEVAGVLILPKLGEPTEESVDALLLLMWSDSLMECLDWDAVFRMANEIPSHLAQSIYRFLMQYLSWSNNEIFFENIGALMRILISLILNPLYSEERPSLVKLLLVAQRRAQSIQIEDAFYFSLQEGVKLIYQEIGDADLEWLRNVHIALGNNSEILIDVWSKLAIS